MAVIFLRVLTMRVPRKSVIIHLLFQEDIIPPPSIIRMTMTRYQASMANRRRRAGNVQGMRTRNVMRYIAR